MKVLTRSNLIVGFLVVTYLLICNPSYSFAGNAIKSSRGYWNFEGSVQIVKHQGNTLKVQILVRNRSTDNSYKSGQCSNGMASCVVDWELWHPDAGNVGVHRTTIQDVCNGSGARIFKSILMPAKYSRLEVRFNITTPNGGHSFQRGRTSWN